jgi:hypothetical protein
LALNHIHTTIATEVGLEVLLSELGEQMYAGLDLLHAREVWLRRSVRDSIDSECCTVPIRFVSVSSWLWRRK